MSSRAKPAVEDMLVVAASGERFWKPTAEQYFALAEIRTKSLSIDKKTIEKTINEVIACAQRDRVAHREWVKNVIDVLTRLANEK